MSDSKTYVLDRYHRHWPVVVWVLLMALMVWAVIATHGKDLGRVVFGTAGATAVAYLMWLGTKRCRIIVSSGGVVERGWIFESTVRFDDVTSHEMSLADNSLGVASLWDDGIGEFIASLFVAMFVLFFVRPFRWLLRLFAYGNQSDEFHRGVLTLYGADKKVLKTIEASEGWHDVEALFRDIVVRLEQRKTTAAS